MPSSSLHNKMLSLRRGASIRSLRKCESVRSLCRRNSIQSFQLKLDDIDDHKQEEAPTLVTCSYQHTDSTSSSTASKGPWMVPTSSSSSSATPWHVNNDNRHPTTVAHHQTGAEKVVVAYLQLCFNHQLNAIEGVEFPQDIVLVDFDCLLDDENHRDWVEDDDAGDDDEFSTDTFAGDSDHSKSSSFIS